MAVLRTIGRSAARLRRLDIHFYVARPGVAAWQQMQQCLRELAELNKERNLRRAREADAR